MGKFFKFNYEKQITNDQAIQLCQILGVNPDELSTLTIKMECDNYLNTIEFRAYGRGFTPTDRPLVEGETEASRFWGDDELIEFMGDDS